MLNAQFLELLISSSQSDALHPWDDSSCFCHFCDSSHLLWRKCKIILGINIQKNSLQSKYVHQCIDSSSPQVFLFLGSSPKSVRAAVRPRLCRVSMAQHCSLWHRLRGTLRHGLACRPCFLGPLLGRTCSQRGDLTPHRLTGGNTHSDRAPAAQTEKRPGGES